MKKTIYLLLFVCSFQLFGQVTATDPDPIILCDINNPGDQMEVFDLTIRESQIINGQTNVEVSYHPTSGDALGNGGVIPNPESYINTTNPQQIFIRLQSTTSNDYDLTILLLQIPVEPLIVEQPDDIVVEDTNNDGFATFDLTVNEAQAVGNQDPFLIVFSYYETLQDAENKTNLIANPTQYNNIAANQQTIYVRMEPIEEVCEFVTYSFDIMTSESLGLSTNKKEEILLYPNPVSETIHIKSESVIQSIVVYDTLGKVITTKENSTNINISQLSKGLYVIEVITESSRQFLKIIKK